MRLKQLIKQFIPPIIIGIIRRIIFPKVQAFKSFKETIDVINEDFNNKELVEVISLKTKNYINKLYKKKILLGYEEHKLINLFCLNPKKNYKVLDVGGGSGLHFHMLKSNFNKIELDWTILETPEMVKYNRNINYKNLHFTDDINSIKDINFDLIYLSGVIQYVENPYVFLNKILKLNSEKIIITRTPFQIDKEGFFSIQKSLLSENGPGVLPDGYIDKYVKYPRYNFNLYFFKKFIYEKGFDIISLHDGQGILGRELIYKKTFILMMKE